MINECATSAGDVDLVRCCDVDVRLPTDVDVPLCADTDCAGCDDVHAILGKLN